MSTDKPECPNPDPRYWGDHEWELVRHLKVTVNLSEKWYGENEGLQWPDVEPTGDEYAARCKNCGEVSTDAKLIQSVRFPSDGRGYTDIGF